MPEPVPAEPTLLNEPAAPPPPPPEAEGMQSFSPPPPSASRSDQLAEIREMLAEVQSEDRTAAALNPSAAPPVSSGDNGKTLLTPATAAALSDDSLESRPRPAPEPRTISDQDAVETESAIRDKLNISDVRAMAPKPPDPKRLRRAHERKETRRKRREAAGSGAFLTGFLLVVMIAAVMVAIYLLHPQISERVPSIAPALTEYVATIDGWRLGVAETFEGVSGWVTKRLGENT